MEDFSTTLEMTIKQNEYGYVDNDIDSAAVFLILCGILL